MRRRRLLSLAGGSLPILLGGCLGGDWKDGGPDLLSSETRSEPPEYDCNDAERPEPDPPEDEDAIGPATYPNRPRKLTDDERMVQYAEAYEEAYRQNSLVAKYWDRLVRFSMSVDETWTYDAPDDVSVVRLQYRYSDEVETRDGIVISDSPTIFVSYYVDTAVVIRAERTGLREDESEYQPDPALDPDPWKQGKPVECYE